MGASPLMSLGMRAMAASYAAMQTTGHNIANANVAGYSRQSVELATSKGQYLGTGFMGKGVDIASITRAHDEFLTRAAAQSKSLSEMDSARQQLLSQLQAVFPTGEAGLGYNMSQFLNSMSDLAARPGDFSTRQVVIARAQDMATQFNAAASQLTQIQQGLNEDLRTTVKTVNGIAADLGTVNQQIAALKGTGQPPNDLLDQRDRLINQLSGYLQVTTIPADDGTVGVFIGGGQRLVLGTSVQQLQAVPDPSDPSRSALQLVDDGTVRMLKPDSLGGGSLAGLLRFQNQDLVDGRNLIGQMASAIAGVVNQQQMLGVNLQQPAGSVASQPMFSLGNPVAIAASTNSKDGTGAYAAGVTLTVTDPTALQAADYSLAPDPAGSGQFVLTRLSSPPLTRMVNNGDVVDGLRIDVTGTPALSDHFLLKPVGDAASTLTALLQDPRDLAAASPLVATMDPANTGTAAVASMKMVTSPLQPAATAHITFTDNNGGYTWDLLDASGNSVGSGAGTWTAGQPIPAPPADINGFSIRLSGVPRTGDVLDVAPISPDFIGSNNGNALSLAALRDVTFVGRSMAADGSTSGGAVATDAYAAAMSTIGVRVQSAKSTADISAAAAAQAEDAQSSASGVNLDEEAARLIQFQQSYQAAAKVLQVAQSIFETLLQTTTG